MLASFRCSELYLDDILLQRRVDACLTVATEAIMYSYILNSLQAEHSLFIRPSLVILKEDRKAADAVDLAKENTRYPGQDGPLRCTEPDYHTPRATHECIQCMRLGNFAAGAISLVLLNFR